MMDWGKQIYRAGGSGWHRISEGERIIISKKVNFTLLLLQTLRKKYFWEYLQRIFNRMQNIVGICKPEIKYILLFFIKPSYCLTLVCRMKLCSGAFSSLKLLSNLPRLKHKLLQFQYYLNHYCLFKVSIIISYLLTDFLFYCMYFDRTWY